VRLRSILLVTAQFLCLGYVILTGPLLARQWLLFLLECGGLGLGTWAIWAMGFENLTVFPHPRQNHLFVERGPYRLVRHPMYLAVLSVSVALVGEAFTIARGAIWLGLLLTIILKILYEEQLLAARFEAYSQYRQRTRRLVPYLY
jgi:protein-S-isoprenylcysteine O-methyltransferase Ste14